MTFQYSEVFLWGLGGFFLVSWMTSLVIQRSQEHFLGHLGGLDLVFIDLECDLGSPWDSLSTPFGDKFMILDVQMACGIRKSISQ